MLDDAVTEKERFLTSMTLFSLSRFMPGNSTWRGPGDQLRPAGDCRVQPLEAAVVDGQHVVLHRLDQPQPLQGGEPLRILRGQVVGLRPVGAAVVELPDVFVERGQLPQWAARVCCGG